jgi:hypothetical protein
MVCALSTLSTHHPEHLPPKSETKTSQWAQLKGATKSEHQ